MIRPAARALLALALVGTAGCGGAPQTPAPAGGPSLVVLLVVDQLTPDLLQRYRGQFTHGLRRLLDDGLVFPNATHDHANTVTAAGHTTLSTGVYPARHGIVANEWFERVGDQWSNVYSMTDLAAPIVDHPQLEGMSPRNIQRPGLADWIVANNERARVVSISSKDRSAIGMAARAVGDVYWIGEQEGVFVTSAYYRAEYPRWVADFNERVMPGLYDATEWSSEVPASAEALSRPDASRYERRGEHTVFPHRADDEAEDESPAAFNLWRTEQTPIPDRAVVSLALEALDELELGRRGVVDFLGVSLSQTDRIGHLYGPGSREQLDNLLRLDAEVERLLSALDETVGPGAWVLALSADHGVLEIPEHLAETGVPAGRLSRDHRAQLLERIEAALPGGPWAVAESIAALPFVGGAYSFEEIESGQPSDSFAVLYSRSHSRTRIVSLAARSGVYARWQPNFLGWEGAVATHGSPYYYDRHVPLIFLGAGIPSGVTDERAATVDVAPTLASLAGIPAPDDLDGRVLASVGRR